MIQLHLILILTHMHPYGVNCGCISFAIKAYFSFNTHNITTLIKNYSLLFLKMINYKPV